MKQIFIFTSILMVTSCQKFLDHKNAKSDVVPSSFKDFQAILDDASTMNGSALGGVMPGLGIVGADDYWVSYNAWQSQGAVDRNAYTFASDIFGSSGCSDWTAAYKMVFNSNVVLEGLSKLDAGDPSFPSIKGAALFFRSEAYFYLAQLFAKPYGPSATTDLGIPLRTTADISAPSVRATLAETYDQITRDLRDAYALLPVTATPAQTRPVKAAAAALLARTFLNKAQYDSALLWSARSLALQSTLLNFATLDTSASQTSTPFPAWPNNKEIIHYALAQSYGITDGTNYSVDSNLIASYQPGDLRKNCFYRPNGTGFVFKGRFGGTSYRFAGLTVAEQMYIHAESAARLGDAATANADLNTVLRSRYRTGSFTDYHVADADSSLRLLLREKRKEFPFMGTIRWEELRRLNQDPRFATTLTHNLNGQSYSLAPNDPKWVFPLPLLEIKLYQLPQNPR